jgi:hypothetical protein
MVEGISKTRPPFAFGASARDRATMAASAAPLCANCIACATFSPNTSFGRRRS